MAVQTPILLAEGGIAATSGPGLDPIEVTLSRAVTPGALVLVGVNAVFAGATSASSVAPTISGGGVALTRHAAADHAYLTNVGGVSCALWLYLGVASDPSGTSVTVTPGAAWIAATAHVVEISGAATGSGGAAAVLQAVMGSGAPGSGAQMATLASEDNAFVQISGYMRWSTLSRTFQILPEFSALSAGHGAYVSPDGPGTMIHASYAIGFMEPDPLIGFQLSGNADASGVIAIELAAADGGGDPPDPTTVAIDQSDPQQVEVGSTLQLSATVTNGDGATTWASDDEAVATVDASGLVSGVAVGSAEITATNNGVSDSITVNVEAAPAQAPTVTITSPAGNIAVTEGTTIVATATATDPVDGDLSAQIEWTSSVDGALGTGAKIEIVTEGWTEGNRTITATVENSAELQGSDDFVLTIGEAPEPPEPEARFDAARFAINTAGGIA